VGDTVAIAVKLSNYFGGGIQYRANIVVTMGPFSETFTALPYAEIVWLNFTADAVGTHSLTIVDGDTGRYFGSSPYAKVVNPTQTAAGVAMGVVLAIVGSAAALVLVIVAVGSQKNRKLKAEKLLAIEKVQVRRGEGGGGKARTRKPPRTSSSELSCSPPRCLHTCVARTGHVEPLVFSRSQCGQLAAHSTRCCPHRAPLLAHVYGPLYTHVRGLTLASLARSLQVVDDARKNLTIENSMLRSEVAIMQDYNKEEIAMLEGQIQKFMAEMGMSAAGGLHQDMGKLLIKADELTGKLVIGAGAYGEVYKSDYRGTAVAVKTMKQVDEESLEGFKGEIMLLSGLRHQNIVTMVGCCWEKDLMALVMEYCEKGTSTDVLKAEGANLTWDDPLFKWLLDLGRGMNYLHGMTYYDTEAKEQVRGIIHRDLKPDNCLVTETWGIKISDFGEARAALENATMTRVGTPIYVAPEIVKGDHYSGKADVFSFAMAILQFCLKEKPLLDYLKEEYQKLNGKEPNLSRVCHDVVIKGWRPDTDSLGVVVGAPKSLLDLLLLSWADSPNLRPTFAEIVEYVQTEVRDEVMGTSGTEGVETEGKGTRRTSTSGGLAVRIQLDKGKKERDEENAEDVDWEGRCYELEEKLKEALEGKKPTLSNTSENMKGYLKDVGKDI